MSTHPLYIVAIASVGEGIRLVKDGVISLGKFLWWLLKKTLTYQATIDSTQSPLCVRAIKQELKKMVDNSRSVVIGDSHGSNNPTYELPNGTYRLTTDYGTIVVTIDDNEISLLTPFWNSMDSLQDWFNDIYKSNVSTGKVVTWVPMEEKNWGIPFFRRPRDISKIVMTPSMKLFTTDLAKFFNSEKIYSDKGQPYRYGFLLQGPSGTGKGTAIEYTSIKYNMPVYLLSLNVSSLTDTLLVKMVSQVRPRSIIVIEEIDQQIQSLENSPNCQLSTGGILSALDGPQRLAHGVIIIATTNNPKYFDTDFGKSLLRPGRFDKSLEFNDVYVPSTIASNISVKSSTNGSVKEKTP